MTAATAITPVQAAAARFGEFTVTDVRTPGQYATGRLSGGCSAGVRRG